MDLVDILSVFASGGISTILGGVTGLVGTWLTKRYEFKQRDQELEGIKIKYSHELNMKQADAEIMRQEWEGREKVAIVEGETAESVADAQAFNQSMKTDPQSYSSKTKRSWVIEFLLGILDFVRGMIRPGLTIYLMGVNTVIFFTFYGMYQEYGMTVSPEQVFDILLIMVNSFLYLNMTAASWWYGTRNKQVPPQLPKP